MRITANRIEDKEWSTKTQTRPLILPGGVPELSLALGGGGLLKIFNRSMDFKPQ
jgi:hypothetical protein